MNSDQVIEKLVALGQPEKIEIKAKKFAITATNSLGIYHSDLKLLAKSVGQDNRLALELYETGIYEARILCSKIYDPDFLTEEQMDQWAAAFENWEICDSFCMGLFAKSSHALVKAREWSEADSEFVKRAGFVIMAAYGFANKKSDNRVFESFFEPIEREVGDDRIYVRKAVNWALRNIGKRNADLNSRAIEVANRLLLRDAESATWIAKHALRELTGTDVKILDYPRHIYRPVVGKARSGKKLPGNNS